MLCTAVELGCVCRVVLLGIVGVHRVRHVRGQKEAPARRDEHKEEAPARRDEQSLGGGVRRVRCEAGGDALQRLVRVRVGVGVRVGVNSDEG
eukprot:scaffold28659_cov59-Phaeocystis_antarctica.AAC.7